MGIQRGRATENVSIGNTECHNSQSGVESREARGASPQSQVTSHKGKKRLVLATGVS